MTCSNEDSSYALLPKKESYDDDEAEEEDRQKASRASFWPQNKTIPPVVLTILTCVVVALALTLLTRSSSSRRSITQNQCQHPNQRHEWRNLSDAQKGDYLRAVQCLRTLPSKMGLNHTLYDDFPYFHSHTGESGTYFCNQQSMTELALSKESIAHFGPVFLGWHRYFMHIYETTLRSDCGYKGHLPYWDWSLDWRNLTKAPVFDDELGFGGNGNASDQVGFRGHCVTDGAFARLQVLFIGPMTVPHCLSREFAAGEDLTKYGQWIQPQALDRLFEEDSFEDFSRAFEEGAHLAVPFSVHGDFSVLSAPQDPLWYLNHAQVDRLWWKWQRLRQHKTGSSTHNKPRKPSTSTEGDAFPDTWLRFGALSAPVQASQVLDTETDPLCYTY